MRVFEAATSRGVDRDTFTDLTPVEVVSVRYLRRPVVRVVFADDLDEQTSQRVLDRLLTPNGNAEVLRGRGRQALAGNRDYLALEPKTQADVVAQVAALTRQNNGLIRLALNIYDGTD